MELTVSGLCKHFGAPGAIGFHLDVGEITANVGEVTFVMGHNGSGKSVLLKLISGELAPVNGLVWLQLGNEKWQAQEKICPIVRQQADDNLAGDLTVLENLAIRHGDRGLLARLRPKQKSLIYAMEFLKEYPGLLDKLGQPCRTLSVGQRQTLAFLLVASRNAGLLLLDEFLAATDRKTSQLLRKLARDYASNTPACVFVVSHDPKIALEDADRIIVLREGKINEDLHRHDGNWTLEFLTTVL